MAPTKAQRQRYDLLYASCLIRPARRAAVDQVVRRINGSQPRYEKVAKALRMPWYAVGIIHSLEASCDFSRHLHNGEPRSRSSAARPCCSSV